MAFSRRTRGQRLRRVAAGNREEDSRRCDHPLPGSLLEGSGQRSEGSLDGWIDLREGAAGKAAQNVMRWEDYTQTAIDPSDDCTTWYVGDYIKRGAANYSSRIGAFRMPGCGRRR